MQWIFDSVRKRTCVFGNELFPGDMLYGDLYWMKVMTLNRFEVTISVVLHQLDKCGASLYIRCGLRDVNLCA